MASDREFLYFILEQLSGIDGISYRYMMGEYILYIGDKIIGGIFDDRLLIKDVPTARKLMPKAPLEKPYDKGTPMILVDNIDDGDFLKMLITEIYPELPPRPQNRKKSK